MNPISKILNKILQPPLWDKWSGVHLLGGILLAKVGLWLYGVKLYAVLLVLVIALAWELYEWLIEYIDPYGSITRWLINTVSDIVIAVLGAIIVVM